MHTGQEAIAAFLRKPCMRGVVRVSDGEPMARGRIVTCTVNSDTLFAEVLPYSES